MSCYSGTGNGQYPLAKNFDTIPVTPFNCDPCDSVTLSLTAVTSPAFDFEQSNMHLSLEQHMVGTKRDSMQSNLASSVLLLKSAKPLLLKLLKMDCNLQQL